MDKQMLEEMQNMLEEIKNFEERPSFLGDGLADLRNHKVPENELGAVKGMIDEAILGAINGLY